MNNCRGLALIEEGWGGHASDSPWATGRNFADARVELKDYERFGSGEIDFRRVFRQRVTSGMGMVSFLGIVVAEPLGALHT